MAYRRRAIPLCHSGAQMNDGTEEAVQSLRSIPNLVQAINALTVELRTVLARVQTTTTSATTGANGAPPAQVDGYLAITLPNGAAARVPYYKP